MRIVEYRFAIEDDADPVKVLTELTRGLEGTILGGVMLLSTGYGHLVASRVVHEMVHSLHDDDTQAVAAALLRGI